MLSSTLITLDSRRRGGKEIKTFSEMSQQERMDHMKTQEDTKSKRRAEDRDTAEQTQRNEMYQKFDDRTALSNEPGKGFS